MLFLPEMKKVQFKYCVIVAFVAFIQSCNSSTTNNPVLAEVGLKKLYTSNVIGVVPIGTTGEDSILLINEYIRKWIKNELMVQKAEENLTIDQANLTRELEEYRNSLIIYKYKNELMNQRMDTSITDNQIEVYYLNNEDNFNLSKSIVKAIFLKIPVEFANQRQLKEMCSDTSPEGLGAIRDYCIQYAKAFDIFIEKWVDFDVLLNNIPVEIENHEQFLARNNFIEMNDKEYYYFVSIHDYKVKNDIAPLEYVQGNIKSLIINNRKIEFLKQIEDNVYTEGIRRNKFKIHNQ
jgi:hypothetical protein